MAFEVSSVPLSLTIILYAFDLIELNGDDLRHDPLEVRKATLSSLLTKTHAGIRISEYIDADGETVFRHACRLGCEGIVSKQRASIYRSGRVRTWIKVKNPDSPAMTRAWERRLLRAQPH
jgi:bifunctional non-homologous end joining protein LigD